MRILIAQINPTVGDFFGNTELILKGIEEAKKRRADLVLFPELAISGYPPDDFLLLPSFIEKVEQALNVIIKATFGIAVVVGLPRRNYDEGEKKLLNSAAIIENGSLHGYHDKVLLPTYDVFDERRYFEPGGAIRTWQLAGQTVAITICEDIWQHSEILKYSNYTRDPIAEIAPLQPDVVLNLSASPYSYNKFLYRGAVCCKAAETLMCPLLLCNQVGGDDSLIFDGYSLYIGADGMLRSYAAGFKEDYLLIDTDVDIPFSQFTPSITEDLFKALVLGVRDYFRKQHFTKACLGLSGGIDSALVACIAAKALGPENVRAFSMPSRYSTQEGSEEARQLAERLGIGFEVIPIEEPFQTYLDILKPHFGDRPFDTTEENLQARIRGMILMAISNKFGDIVLSTGNKSEFAMGYSTLYGDMCGGLAVIGDVTKRQVYELAHWINREQEIIPWNTIKKPPSAELRPNQKDSDSLPDYEIVDNVLHAYVEEHNDPAQIASKLNYPIKLVEDLIRRIHLAEYKRRQAPPSLRVTEKAFSIGRRFPIVQRFVP